MPLAPGFVLGKPSAQVLIPGADSLVSTRRNLGDAAFRDVGTAIGTVAAGDDPRIGWVVTRTPFDFIPADQHDAIRKDVNAPVARAAFEAMFAAMLASDETSPECTIPAGAWYFDRCVEAVLRSPRANRTFTLHVQQGAKLIHTEGNRYRYRVQGEWDATANTPAITTTSGAVGDAWIAVSGATGLSINGITNVNVGDTLYKGANGWQKILARPRYRMQSWNAQTNQDASGNLDVLPGVGEEGDTVICSVAGSANVDGVTSWAIGDEAYFTLGKWRKKQVQGGTYKGTWNASTNTPALSNSNGTAGDWYIVTGPPAYAPINNGSGQTGLGESITFQPGDKVWCIAPGRWRKVYASPTPRGTWDADGQYQTQFYPASGSTAPVIGRYPLANQGAFGDLWTITEPGTRSAGGIANRAFVRGEFLYYGANGFEVIAQDPNWDRGIFRFFHDDKTCLSVVGRIHFVSRADGRGSDFSAGWAVRSHSLFCPNYQNYLFANEMLRVESILSESDNADAGLAQFASGIWEGVWETRNLYLPRFEDVSLRSTQSDGGARLTSLQAQPRRSAYGIRHVDSYVPRVFGVLMNGDFGCGISIESEVWDAEKASYEGGDVVVEGCAGLVDVVSLRHGLRAVSAFGEPTFTAIFKDTNWSRYCMRIHGTTGVDVTMGIPILPGDGGSRAIIDRPSFAYIEDSSSITIHDGIPVGGQYLDENRFSSLVKTRGFVNGLTLERINVSQWPNGVLFDLHHNDNNHQIFNNPGPVYSHTVTLRNPAFLGLDTPGRKLCIGRKEYLDGPYEPLRVNALGGIDTSTNPDNAAALVMADKQVITLSPVFDMYAFGQRVYWRRRSDGKNIMSLDANGQLRLLTAAVVGTDV